MGHPCPASGECAIHYNTRHTDPGSGAGAPPQIRSCGRDIPGGSTWRTRGRHTGLGGADDTLGATSGLPTQVVYVQSRACTDRAASAKRRAREGPIGESNRRVSVDARGKLGGMIPVNRLVAGSNPARGASY